MMDGLDSILTYGGLSTIGGGGMWAYIKMHFNHKEDMALMKQEAINVREKMGKIEDEFKELELKFDLNKDQVLKEIQDLKQTMMNDKLEIINAIHQHIKK